MSKQLLAILIVFLSLVIPSFSQAPVISSFSQNGELVCTNLQPGTLAFVEWAPSVEGPWTNTWAGLNAVTVDAEGTIRVSVPMFYRVLGVAHQTNTVVLIPPGSFTMGNCMDPGEGWDDELPVHSVYVSAFYMDRYEVTKALWDEVKGWNGGNGYSYDYAGSGKAANHPVHSINWYDAVKWCNARSQKEGFAPCYYTDAALTVIYKTGQVAPYVNWNANGYRLPTEAEWEKAARGGVAGHRFPWSDTDTIQHSRGNYESVVHYSYDTSPTRGFHPTFNDGVEPYSSPVGYFAANGYGLYDMAGNMWEWCWDWYSSSYYSSSPGTDPRGPSTGSIRAFRGGAWNSSTRCCRVAERDCDAPPSGGYLPCGFRSVRAAGQ